MTVEQAETPATDAPDSSPEREITFKGRLMWVRLPSPEQLLVWQRTVRQLQDADVGGWNGARVMAALERTRKIIDSVLVHNTDKDWLDDEMLDGTLGLIDTAQIIQLTVEAFEAGRNREQRRAAVKPAKKAARKKAR